MQKTIRNRSAEAFKNALCSLLLKKQLDKITVKEICQLADYTVTAFYKNFEDKYDCARKIVQEEAEYLFETNYKIMCMDGYKSVAEDISEMRSNELVLSTCENYFRRVLSNSTRYRCIVSDLLMSNSIMQFARHFAELAKGKLFYISDRDRRTVDFEYYIGMYISQYLYTVAYWIDEDFQKSPAELARMFIEAYTSDTQILSVIEPE